MEDKYMTVAIYNTIKSFDMHLIIQLGTGHGKSIIIQQTANLIVEKNPSKTVYIICISNYLKQFSIDHYSDRAQKRIQYMTVDQFLYLYPKPCIENSVILLDEKDALSGVDCSLAVTRGQNLVYFDLVRQFNQYKTMIGFTGTYSDISAHVDNMNCKGIPLIKLPHLFNATSEINVDKISYYSNAQDLISVLLYVLGAKPNATIIIIVDDAEDFKTLSTAKSQLIDPTQQPPRNFIVLSDPDGQNVISQLRLLETSPRSIVVASSKFARGTDFRTGVAENHLVLTYLPDSNAQLQQALGRTCRNFAVSSNQLLLKKPVDDHLQFSQYEEIKSYLNQ